MRCRRSVQLSPCDDDDDSPPPPPPRRRLRKQNYDDDYEQEFDEEKHRKGRKQESESEEDDEEKHRKRRKYVKEKSESEEEEDEDEEEEDPPEDAKPIGDSVRVSGKGRTKRTHFESFDLDGTQYDLEDPVLLVPEDQKQKPYVAIIKDVSQSLDGSLMVTGQWFYRPEEAEKKGGGNWQSRDIRELFYSFHRDEVPAESVMHKCVVHFVPLNKQLPKRKEHPGFIVQRVYDTVEQKLWKLTDKDYEDIKQHEINLLVDKTRSRIGEFQDIETTEGIAPVLSDQFTNQRALRKKNISPLDVTKVDNLHSKRDTPASCKIKENSSEHYTILKRFNVLTGDAHRDKWLEKLLGGIQYIFDSEDTVPKVDKEKAGSDEVKNANESKHTEKVSGPQQNNLKGRGSLLWPDDAVPAVSALEKASHEALASDFSKYNQKMRQLVFNLSNNAALTRRLLNGELEPSKILSMSPTELKEGLTAEELAVKEPEESARMQMTDARCKRCQEKQVGLLDIIQAGLKARYQLECFACGNNWYVSGDEASTLTIDEPTTITSPRDSEKPPIVDAVKKTTESHKPVLESQKSFTKSKTDDNPAASTKKTE